jgi:hypothetical protein
MASPTVPLLDLAAFRLSRPQVLCCRTSLPRPIPSNTWPERLRSVVERCTVPAWAWRLADVWDATASGLPEVLPVRPVTESGLPVLLATVSVLPARLAAVLDLPAAVDELLARAPLSIQLPS